MGSLVMMIPVTRCESRGVWTRDHASMDLASTLCLQLCLTTSVLTDQPWSPIVGGSALFPPLVSSPNLLVHSPPLYSEVPHLPHLSLPSFYDKRQHNRRVTGRRRQPYYRRNISPKCEQKNHLALSILMTKVVETHTHTKKRSLKTLLCQQVWTSSTEQYLVQPIQ